MLNELNRIIDYIEGNLTEELSLESISAHIGVSDYHFRKIFYYISGMTISEYIKNRRLTEANKDLLQGERVTDTVFKYGYESVDGFTRAFKRWSGFLPSEVRKKGVNKSLPKFSFIISIKGGTAMEFRTVDKPAFYLAGVSVRVPMQFEGVNNEIVKLAQSITQEQRDEMHALQNTQPFEIVNAFYDADEGFLKEEGGLTHLIGVLTTMEEESKHLEKVFVDANTWVVFPSEGAFPAALQESMANVYTQWLPTSGYEFVKAPTFSFTKMSESKKDYAYSEAWVAVRKV